MYLDVTVSGVATAGTVIRTTSQNPALVFPPNGMRLGIPGTAVSGSNQDDGNLNYGKGSIVSTVAKAYATFDAHYQNYGILVTGKVWGDLNQWQDVPWGNFPNGYAAGTPLGQGGWDSPREIFRRRDLASLRLWQAEFQWRERGGPDRRDQRPVGPVDRHRGRLVLRHQRHRLLCGHPGPGPRRSRN